MKLGFVTCVELGMACMEAIYEVNGSLDLVITLQDHVGTKKSGRIYLDDFCSEKKIQLHKVLNINEEETIQLIKSSQIDWLFIIGWSQIASIDVLNASNLGALGMHPTLLPIGRGRAAIPWAIIKGLSKTGVTLFKLDEGVDTGPILGQIEIPLTQDINATDLYELCNQAHVELIKNIIPLLDSPVGIQLYQQDNTHATFWPGRTPEDGIISKQMTCKEVDTLVRALTRPYPGAYIQKADGTELRIWKGYIKSMEQRSHPLTSKELEIELFDGMYVIKDWEIM